MTRSSQGEGSYGSRKFIVTIVGMVVILLIALGCAMLNVAGEHITEISTSIAGVTGAYVIGQGYADGQAAKNQ